MKTRSWLSIGLAAATVAACQVAQPWTISVYNNDADMPVRIRITTPNMASEWVLRPQQIATLARQPGSVGGTVSVLDPDTCETVARQPFDPAGGMLVIVDQGVTGAGPWQIIAEADDPIVGTAVLAAVPPCSA